jgi:uncharacterized membrane protein
MFSIKNFGMKKWILTLLSILLITDLLIIFDIPFLREVMVFITFTTIPGLLIVHCLRLNHIDFLKKLVLSVGLSVSFIIFTGLLLNTFYPLLLKPLSLVPVLVLFNILLIIMALVAFMRNQDDFVLEDFINLNFKFNGSSSSLLILPLFFPVMAVLGTYLMNNFENNSFLLLMLLLIPVYIVVLAVMRKRVNIATYPVALWSIGLSLLLLYGLTSSHIMGRDINSEYYCFILTLNNSHWNIMDFYNPYNACLSLNILPTIYQVLSGMNPEYVFKVYDALIGSIIPLVLYVVARKYLAAKYSFLASLLFVFQIFFFNLQGAIRQEIAILFFFMAFMVIFSSEIGRNTRKILFLILMFSLIVSHYSTAYVAFVLIVPILILPFIRGLYKERKLDFRNFDVILVSLIFIAIWYILYAHIQLSAGTQVVQTTIAASTASGNSSNFASSKGDFVLGVLGIKLKSLPNTLSVIAHDMIFATIIIGLLDVVRRFKHYKEKFGSEFLIGVGISLLLLVMFVVLPYISIAYDAARLFFQVLIFLAPIFIVGCIAVAKFIKKPKWDIAIILFLLISLFSCASYLQYHFTGYPYSATYDSNGTVRGEVFVNDSEITGVKWLQDNRINGLPIYSDMRETSRFGLANFRDANLNTTFFDWNKTVSSGYIYMGSLNINKKEVLEIFDDISITDISIYSNILERKNIIYDSGGSQIWT